jgi:hypothetical protein
MNLGVTKVHLAVKAIQTRIAQIPKPRNAMLQQLCRNVMVGAQPPIRMFTGYTTCCLSGVSCNVCIDLIDAYGQVTPLGCRVIDVARAQAFERALRDHLRSHHAALVDRIETSKDLSKQDEAELNTVIAAFKATGAY